ncbi:MAG: hypothetical protein ACE5HM_05245, partial [Acidiferrobacterales bacterium]
EQRLRWKNRAGGQKMADQPGEAFFRMLHHSKNRPRPSRVLIEVKEARRQAEDRMGPAERMRAAFALSRQMVGWFQAGLRAQGFTEQEIRNLFHQRRQ